MSEVTQEDYDAIEYVKPSGVMLFKSALVHGFPSRCRPDTVLVEVIKDGGEPIQFVGAFINVKFKAQIIPAFGDLLDLSVYERDAFVKHYNERRLLYQQGGSDWLSTIREKDYYVVHGKRRKLNSISLVKAPDMAGLEKPVCALLRFGKEEKMDVI